MYKLELEQLGAFVSQSCMKLELKLKQAGASISQSCLKHLGAEIETSRSETNWSVHQQEHLTAMKSWTFSELDLKLLEPELSVSCRSRSCKRQELELPRAVTGWSVHQREL